MCQSAESMHTNEKWSWLGLGHLAALDQQRRTLKKFPEKSTDQNLTNATFRRMLMRMKRVRHDLRQQYRKIENSYRKPKRK